MQVNVCIVAVNFLREATVHISFSSEYRVGLPRMRNKMLKY